MYRPGTWWTGVRDMVDTSRQSFCRSPSCPWSPRDTMSLRHEFVLLAQQEGCNRRQLCQRYGISPQTGYKWIARYTEQEMAGFGRAVAPASDQSDPNGGGTGAVGRRPAPAAPGRGGRKISRRLQDLGHTPVPAPSTVTSILHRHGLISPEASVKAQPWQRFEHAAPNQLWQMDFKGGFRTRWPDVLTIDGTGRSFPLRVTLAACTQTHTAVVGAATRPFATSDCLGISADKGRRGAVLHNRGSSPAWGLAHPARRAPDPPSGPILKPMARTNAFTGRGPFARRRPREEKAKPLVCERARFYITARLLSLCVRPAAGRTQPTKRSEA